MSEKNTGKQHQINLNLTEGNRVKLIDHSKSFEQVGVRIFVKLDCS